MHNNLLNKIKTATIMLCVMALVIQMTSCSSNDELKLIPVKTGGKCGFIDKTGKYLINPQFQDAGLFKDGLALVVTMDEKYGFINEKGKYVINPQFIYAKEFSDGLAYVVTEDGKEGFVDKKGKFIIGPLDCEDIMPFSEGFTFISPYDSEPICYDAKGKSKFKLSNIIEIHPFHSGRAKFVDLEYKSGLLNTNGDIVVKAQYDDIGEMSEGLYRVEVDGKYGFIDKNGAVIINVQFDYVDCFSDGLAAFEQNDKWGYINTKGKITINPQFDEAFEFDEGLACVLSGNQYGVIDKTGKYVINPQFDSKVEFHEGLAAFLSGSLYGYVNKNGKIVINPQFDFAYDFKKDLAIIVQEGRDNKQGFINKKGEYVISPQFDWTSTFYGNIAVVVVNDKVGIIDKNGKYVVNPQFDGVGSGLVKFIDHDDSVVTDGDYVMSSYAKNIKVSNKIVDEFFNQVDMFKFQTASVENFDRFDYTYVINKYEIKGNFDDLEYHGYFKEPVYHVEKTYTTNWWGERYESGSERVYHLDDECGVLAIKIGSDYLEEYDINTMSLEKLVVKTLQDKYGVKFDYDSNNDIYFCFDSTKQKGIGVNSSDYYVTLYLIQDKSVFDDNIKNF